MTKYYNNKPHTSPEGVDSLSLEDPHGTVNHAIVRLVKTSLLDHLVLEENIEIIVTRQQPSDQPDSGQGA